jgi:hypothetical protein
MNPIQPIFCVIAEKWSLTCRIEVKATDSTLVSLEKVYLQLRKGRVNLPGFFAVLYR